MRTRDARSFAWGFVALNAIGSSLLAWRSAEIGERAFLALNVVTAAFWAFVALLKCGAFQRAVHNRQRAREQVAPHAES